ncbi:hypothetical protein AKJ62_04265 [candidate division MSBL1 archaeon SCGC-AAA259D14]|uniref:Uncharacterized protein n=1 Tax=candidate division MSBL1 archaeon SCGC-AAA259D14 TaxID=1698261 RepID=A0A133U3W7_9EURY|nr:hypothetical protein AKJ62_04265 [candidate division MSBL1 archaeon SCGC-AAA259D14]
MLPHGKHLFKKFRFKFSEITRLDVEKVHLSSQKITRLYRRTLGPKEIYGDGEGDYSLHIQGTSPQYADMSRKEILEYLRNG